MSPKPVEVRRTVAVPRDYQAWYVDTDQRGRRRFWRVAYLRGATSYGARPEVELHRVCKDGSPFNGRGGPGILRFRLTEHPITDSMFLSYVAEATAGWED